MKKLLLWTLLLLLGASPAAPAQRLIGVFANGGALSEGPDVRLFSAVGQNGAGVMQAVDVRHGAGFWFAALLPESGVFTPLEPTTAPGSFALAQNYPNPFARSTRIVYELPVPARVRLAVYDLYGRLVQEVYRAHQPAGRYQIPFEAGTLASGTYFYRLDAGAYHAVRQMMLVR